MDIQAFTDMRSVFTELPKELVEFAEKMKIAQLRGRRNWKRGGKMNWVVKHRMNQDDDERLNASFQGILNKIGENNFDEISAELLQLEIETPEHLDKLVEMVFMKAVREDKFSEIYIRLCTMMFGRYVTDPEDKKVFFRNLLLARCQDCFVSCLQTDTEEQLKEIGLRGKNEMIGLVKLIGGLYNNSLLTNSIVFDCLITLTMKVTEQRWYGIDALCTLFTSVEQMFKKNCPEDFKRVHQFLEDMAKNKKLRARDRFAIMDTVGK